MQPVTHTADDNELDASSIDTSGVNTADIDTSIADADQSTTPTPTPELPAEYNDVTRSSVTEDGNVASHLESHWGF
jgi:hypothetical protein